MSDTSDYQYEAFYNLMQSSDAAHNINAIKAMADTNNLISAQSELMLIPDTNTVNHNRITVGTIYLNTWALDSYELTEVQSRTLTDLAYLDPYTNGDAVYMARVMMNINPDDENNESKAMQQKPKQIVKANAVHVYPNPAKETITITFDQAISNDGTFEIWNIMGSKILSNTIPKNYTEQKVDVSNLISGIYFYIIKVNGEKFSSGKLTIINK